MKTVLLVNHEAKDEAVPHLVEVAANPAFAPPCFTEETLDTLCKTLSVFTQNKIDDDVWEIKYVAARHYQKIRFPKLDEFDALLLRTLVIEKLVNAEKNIANDINMAEEVFAYFKMRKVSVSHCTTGFFEQYYNDLSISEYSPTYANNLLRVLAKLVTVCDLYGLRSSKMRVDCSKRFSVDRKIKEAPEAEVVFRLDALFFDLTNEIPLPYRTIYMLIRLICNRISEVLNMSIDCLSYPVDDVFSVSIPTFKETSLHALEYHSYKRLKSGFIESILHDCLCKQIEYAKQCQNNMKAGVKGLLFVDPTGKAMVNGKMFNQFLCNLCVSNQIFDSTGEIAKITSHDFRHFGVTERNASQVISLDMTSQECNHRSSRITMGYGYPSKKDNVKNSRDILSSVFPEQFKTQDDKVTSYAPQEVRESKYLLTEKQPFTRLLPGAGICSSIGCVPRFVSCAKCESFVPDPNCKEQLVETHLRLIAKIEQLEKSNADSKVIAFNKDQADTIQALLIRLNQTTEVTNEQR